MEKRKSRRVAGHDIAIGHAVPAASIVARLPGLRVVLQRLLAAERDRSRSTMVQFVAGGGIRITVMEFATPAKRALVEVWSFELPVLVRGRIVSTLAEWGEVEFEREIVRPDLG